MTVAAWSVAVLVGFGVSIVASARTVTYASALAAVTRFPPFLVGMTLLAVGTDLPEIANSIVSGNLGPDCGIVGGAIATITSRPASVLPWHARFIARRRW